MEIKWKSKGAYTHGEGGIYPSTVRMRVNALGCGRSRGLGLSGTGRLLKYRTTKVVSKKSGREPFKIQSSTLAPLLCCRENER